MSRSTPIDQGWTFRRAGADEEWLPAEIPGHVHLDLMRNGLIPDPFYGTHERELGWIDEADWEYRCVFPWNPGEPQKVLKFEGLDTVCTVHLNGHQVAESDDMFLPLRVDIEGALKPGENELLVRFSSAVRVGLERRAAFLKAEKLPDNIANLDERAFIRKAQYMFGWDWGPRLVSCGIWKPVAIVDSDEAVAAGHEPEGRVQLVQQSDSYGRSFCFQVDGKPLWAMGANWIPDDSFPSRITRKQLRSRLAAAKEIGMNMLRVWGGGLYESEDFYELCDELGIWVWQDFPYACSYYPDGPAEQGQASEEARDNIKRIRCHPSLALWCGNNENEQLYQDGWGGKDRQPYRYLGEHLYNGVLPQAVQDDNPRISYIPGSPMGGEYCNQGGIGDQHFWDVWHGRGDWKFYEDSTARFCSEFGFASAASLNVWRKYIDDDQRHPDSEQMRWHDKTGKPWETFKGLVELHYPKYKNLEDWVYFSQLNQRDAMRHAIEHYRRTDYCKGTLIWQLNDCWPVQSWSLIDCEGVWKAAAHELVRLYRPVLLSISLMKDRAEIWLANDSQEAMAPISVPVRLLNTWTGQLLSLAAFQSSNLGPGERLKLGELEVLPSWLNTHALVAGEGELVNWRFVGEPKDMRLRVPQVDVQVKGNTAHLTFDGPAFDVWLWDGKADARFKPNFFSVFEAGDRTIQVEGELGELRVRALAGAK